MSDRTNYLYDNKHSEAKKRLRGLEDIEDENTISLLEKLPVLEGQVCLDVGAGAGSIAEWLATRVGPSGAVVATDIEPVHLDGSNYEIRQHDIEKDILPHDEFDLVHFRHLLIHLAHPTAALRKILASVKPGGILLAEESDLTSWSPDDALPEHLQTAFQSGVDAVFEVYDSRGIDTEIGRKLPSILTDIGFTVADENEHKRTVNGGSPEAVYQSLSAEQLARSLDRTSRKRSKRLGMLAECLLNPDLRYQSRTTVSVSAVR